MPLVRGFPGFRMTLNLIARPLLSEWQLLVRTVAKRMKILVFLLVRVTKLKFPLVPNYPMAFRVTWRHLRIRVRDVGSSVWWVGRSELMLW